MKGYHCSTFDEHGRLRFIEINGAKASGHRLINPRTITECVMCNKHYIVK